MPFLYREFSDHPFKRSGCFLCGKVFLNALGKTEADLQAIRNKAVKEGIKAVNAKTESKGEVKEQARRNNVGLTEKEMSQFYSV